MRRGDVPARFALDSSGTHHEPAAVYKEQAFNRGTTRPRRLTLHTAVLSGPSLLRVRILGSKGVVGHVVYVRWLWYRGVMGKWGQLVL